MGRPSRVVDGVDYYLLSYDGGNYGGAEVRLDGAGNSKWLRRLDSYNLPHCDIPCNRQKQTLMIVCCCFSLLTGNKHLDPFHRFELGLFFPSSLPILDPIIN